MRASPPDSTSLGRHPASEGAIVLERAECQKTAARQPDQQRSPPHAGAGDIPRPRGRNSRRKSSRSVAPSHPVKQVKDFSSLGTFYSGAGQARSAAGSRDLAPTTVFTTATAATPPPEAIGPWLSTP